MAGNPLKRIRAKLARGEELIPEELALLDTHERQKIHAPVASGANKTKLPKEPAPNAIGTAWEAVNDESLRDTLSSRVVDEPPDATYSHVAVQRMAQMGVPDTEIADIVGVPVDQLRSEAQEALKLGRLIGDVQLRVSQFAAAMAGDRTLQVWLGKTRLNQVDKVSAELTGKDGGPIQMQHAAVAVRAKLEEILASAAQQVTANREAALLASGDDAADA